MLKNNIVNKSINKGSSNQKHSLSQQYNIINLKELNNHSLSITGNNSTTPVPQQAHRNINNINIWGNQKFLPQNGPRGYSGLNQNENHSNCFNSVSPLYSQSIFGYGGKQPNFNLDSHTTTPSAPSINLNIRNTLPSPKSITNQPITSNDSTSQQKTQIYKDLLSSDMFQILNNQAEFLSNRDYKRQASLFLTYMLDKLFTIPKDLWSKEEDELFYLLISEKALLDIGDTEPYRNTLETDLKKACRDISKNENFLSEEGKDQSMLASKVLTSIFPAYNGNMRLQADSSILNAPNSKFIFPTKRQNLKLFCHNMPSSPPLFLFNPSIRDIEPNPFIKANWILTVLGSIVYKNPDFFKSIMKDNLNSTVDVMLHSVFSKNQEYTRVDRNPLLIFDLDYSSSHSVFNRIPVGWIDSICKAITNNINNTIKCDPCSQESIDLSALGYGTPEIAFNLLFGAYSTNRIYLDDVIENTPSLRELVGKIIATISNSTNYFSVATPRTNNKKYSKPFSLLHTIENMGKPIIFAKNYTNTNESGTTMDMNDNVIKNSELFSTAYFIKKFKCIDISDSNFNNLIKKIDICKSIYPTKQENDVLNDTDNVDYSKSILSSEKVSVLGDIILRYINNPNNLNRIYSIFTESQYIFNRSPQIISALARQILLSYPDKNISSLFFFFDSELFSLAKFNKAAYILSDYTYKREFENGNNLYSFSDVFTGGHMFIKRALTCENPGLFDKKVEEINSHINNVSYSCDNATCNFTDKESYYSRINFSSVYIKAMRSAAEIVEDWLNSRPKEETLKDIALLSEFKQLDFCNDKALKGILNVDISSGKNQIINLIVCIFNMLMLSSNIEKLKIVSDNDLMSGTQTYRIFELAKLEYSLHRAFDSFL